MAKKRYKFFKKLSVTLWEREAEVRTALLGKPGEPWDTWADSAFPLAGNWSKTGVDHMFDHNWKNQ